MSVFSIPASMSCFVTASTAGPALTRMMNFRGFLIDATRSSIVSHATSPPGVLGLRLMKSCITEVVRL
jgi:hypothetical protein